jgi:hypothetical protein
VSDQPFSAKTSAARSGRASAFPDAGNTGAPRRARLSAYRGPCTITHPNTEIDHKLVRCDLDIRAAGVTVRRSFVEGTISSGSEARRRHSFTLVGSTLDVSPRGTRLLTGVGDVHFKVIRSEIRGGNRGINCWYDCVVRSSWIHGQDTDRTGSTHESGVRMGQRGVIRGNSIGCDAPDVPPDAGCSAGLTGYGDFGPVRHNLVAGNLFLASTGGTCAYGGSSAGKPYSGAARDIRFLDNVFQRGRSGNCGYWAPILDFDRRAPGNEWRGNTWTTGQRVRL